MKRWEDRFFKKNKEIEVEVSSRTIDHVIRATKGLGWQFQDEFWAPDLQVSRFTKEQKELFVIQETYFDPKLTGQEEDIMAIQNAVSKINLN